MADGRWPKSQISPPYSRRGCQIELAQRRNLTGVVARRDLHHILPQYPGCLVTHMYLVLQIGFLKKSGDCQPANFKTHPNPARAGIQKPQTSNCQLSTVNSRIAVSFTGASGVFLFDGRIISRSVGSFVTNDQNQLKASFTLFLNPAIGTI